MIRIVSIARSSLFLLALAAAGCATSGSNRSAGHWLQAETQRDVPYQTILVVGISPDSMARRAFEETLAKEISEGDSTGVPAFKIRSQMGSPELSKEVVIAMAETAGADAVIVVRAVKQEIYAGKSQEDVIVHLGRQVRVNESEDGNITTAVASNYSVEVVPGSMILEDDAVVQSSLYETATGDQLIYRAITNAHLELDGSGGVQMVAYHLALSIAKQLRRDGVIQ